MLQSLQCRGCVQGRGDECDGHWDNETDSNSVAMLRCSSILDACERHSTIACPLTAAQLTRCRAPSLSNSTRRLLVTIGHFVRAARASHIGVLMYVYVCIYVCVCVCVFMYVYVCFNVRL